MSRKAIFLDRDGVINEERKDYVKKISELKILKNVSESVRKLKDNGFLIIVITNQSAINRGIISQDTLKEIHQFLQEYMEKNNAALDAVYFCPHTPNENCQCRKPKPGMILQAANDFHIDLNQSWFLGNSQSDLIAANDVGCKGILIDENNDLQTIVKQIIKNSNS